MESLGSKDRPVLLINPLYEHVSAVMPPLGLAYLAAVLAQHNIPVKILEANAYKMSHQEIIEEIREAAPTIIGITVPSALIGYVSKLSQLIKAEFPNVLIVHGGPHATLESEACLMRHNADAVVRGEGEYTFLDLCQKYNGSVNSLAEIRGTAYRVNGEVVYNKPRGHIADLDTLPFPARHLLPLDKYKTLATSTRFATILTSRGCPGKCQYCTKGVFGSRFRARSVKNIVDEIEVLVRAHKVKEIDIIDDTFTYDMERAEKVCDEMVRRGLRIPWRLSNGIRVDRISGALLDKMENAGCYQISYGVESGDDEVLCKIGKGISTQQVREAFKMTKERNIETIGFFMLGLPFDTVETMKKTIRFAKELGPDYAQFTITTPLPGTPLWNWLKSRGKLLIEPDWTQFNLFSGRICFETDGFKKEDIEKLVTEAYRTFYLRPSYILKSLVRIRRWRDLRRYIAGFSALLTLSGLTLVKKRVDTAMSFLAFLKIRKAAKESS